MTFETICNSCGDRWGAKSVNQAFMIKHARKTYQENHEIEVKDEVGSVVKIE